MPVDNATLSRLRRQIATLEGGAEPENRSVIPFGLPAIDTHLPAGGLANSSVHEITDGGDDKSVGGSATAFAAALAGHAQYFRRAPIVWIAPRTRQRESLYGPGLAAFGLDPARLIAIRVPASGREGTAQALWAMEEALRTPSVGAVCAEIDDVDLTASRRLQLAAEAGGTFGLLLRGASKSILPPIASVTRWRITAAPSGPAWPICLPGAPRWQVELLRARNGRPHHWLLEWRHDPGNEAARGFALAAETGNRPALPAEAKRVLVPLARTG